MVLFKRKPFALLPTAPDIPDNAEVFIMRGTNEVFTDYEKYLKRLDYLSQNKFVDAVNGKSGLSFFDALESENKSTNAIENVFPEVLRDPILRKVQFSTISRIDDLVNAVYDEFKRDFFPGEEVFCSMTHEQLEGTIREKAVFPMIRGPNGDVQRAAFSRYFVTLHTAKEEEALMDDKGVRRDRKTFTKQNLRAFLKHSLQREAWIGAPWLVKEHLAIQYRLPMEIPAHLLQDAKVLASKVKATELDSDRSVRTDVSQQQTVQAGNSRKRTKNFSQDEFRRLQAEEQERIQAKHPGRKSNGTASHDDTRQPPPPVIKYPIEDLDLAPKRNGVVRPTLEFFTDEMQEYVKDRRKALPSDITMESMGMLLEAWNTLNVQCEVYFIDSFTFDDFVDAMRYQFIDPPCELLEEANCAVLKLLVDDKGAQNVPKNVLPEIKKELVEDSSEEAHDDSEMSTPLPDAPAKSTRSRLSHVETIDSASSPAVPPSGSHRASDMLGDRDWKTRLAARDFTDGGWQIILIGCLHHIAQVIPRWKSRAEKILAWLAPMDAEPTAETAIFQYASMNVNLRISALQMIMTLSISTHAIRDFLETCSEDMTDVRKRKIEHQKAKKNAMELLAVKDRDRKIQLPDNMVPDSPKQESVEPRSVNGEADELIDASMSVISDSDEDAAAMVRTLRRGNDRKRKREVEAARAAEEKKKVELQKQVPKQTKEFKKLLIEIDELKRQIVEHEGKIAECDSDLREANVQRTKVLGRDRFCNRYYWFERNGQPFGGLPNSSTSSYGYANGRIWVQGPDALEKAGLIDRTKEDQEDYQRQFNLTVAERRDIEEGTTVLQSAHEWGYYDNPVLLDNLIGWLDERGDREKKLRKELTEWRDTIVQYMDAHKKFKDEEAAKKVEADEDNASRISTRHRVHEDLSAARVRCLRWTNSMAIEELGHPHSRPERPKPKQRIALRQAKGIAVPVNRHGKPVTRQGVR